jgi:transposase
VGNGKEFPVKKVFSESTTIGVDVGIRNFTVFQLEKGLKILST